MQRRFLRSIPALDFLALWLRGAHWGLWLLVALTSLVGVWGWKPRPTLDFVPDAAATGRVTESTIVEFDSDDGPPDRYRRTEFEFVDLDGATRFGMSFTEGSIARRVGEAVQVEYVAARPEYQSRVVGEDGDLPFNIIPVRYVIPGFALVGLFVIGVLLLVRLSKLRLLRRGHLSRFRIKKRHRHDDSKSTHLTLDVEGRELDVSTTNVDVFERDPRVLERAPGAWPRVFLGSFVVGDPPVRLELDDHRVFVPHAARTLRRAMLGGLAWLAAAAVIFLL